MNLLTETLKYIKYVDKTINDIEYIYIKNISVWNKPTIVISSKTWQPELLDFEYANGYGSQEIEGWITFHDNTWLEREEYDGSESWVYRSKPGPEDLI